MSPIDLAHILNRTSRAVGALVTRPDGRLLMVRDRLRREWSYPAGYVDRGEQPLEAALRELREEVNIRLTSDRLEFAGTRVIKRPLGKLEFTTYRAGVTTEEIANLKLQAIELTAYKWVTPDEALELTSARLRPRLRELLSA